jgi:hypothetical protein
VRTRNVIIGAIVLVVATAATTFVIVDTRARNDERERDRLERNRLSGDRLVPLLVSTEDIPANQPLDPLIDRGIFKEVQYPRDQYVDGAVVDVAQLQGMTTTAVILANEQVSLERLRSSDAT